MRPASPRPQRIPRRKTRAMAETGGAAQYAGHPKPNQLFREPSKPSWTTRNKPSIIELECEKSSIEMLEVIYDIDIDFRWDHKPSVPMDFILYPRKSPVINHGLLEKSPICR